MQIYQNSDFYFFRKPHSVASTFGKEKSFLDYFFLDKKDMPHSGIDYESISSKTKSYIDDQIKILNLTILESKAETDHIIQNLINIFGKEKEFGLLNRLDNDTGGLLYFAKSQYIYNDYKIRQNDKMIQKFYIAQVLGNPFFKSDKSEININYPIMHHKFSEDRMIFISKPGDEKNGKGKKHSVDTKISLLNFDGKENRSILLISIHKGTRHQIRVHLSSIGCPIIGENIYSKHQNSDFLHLRSVGFK